MAANMDSEAELPWITIKRRTNNKETENSKRKCPSPTPDPTEANKKSPPPRQDQKPVYIQKPTEAQHT
ncbi:hypothetical protein QLX08_005309 [Tetragonisca angustula]|uniref:Uncharacterized protein n=1 Tax=Tetragonisca angustula TaxID=166442 RepID=A0AAW0ZYR4_9HYME